MRQLLCWGTCWLALMVAPPAFGQVDDVSYCLSPRALNISAVVGAAPTLHFVSVNEAICPLEEVDRGTANLSVTYLNGTGWLSVPASVLFAPGEVNSIPVTVNYAALPGAGVYQALISGIHTDMGERPSSSPFRSRSH